MMSVYSDVKPEIFQILYWFAKLQIDLEYVKSTLNAFHPNQSFLLIDLFQILLGTTPIVAANVINRRSGQANLFQKQQMLVSPYLKLINCYHNLYGIPSNI